MRELSLNRGDSLAAEPVHLRPVKRGKAAERAGSTRRWLVGGFQITRVRGEGQQAAVTRLKLIPQRRKHLIAPGFRPKSKGAVEDFSVLPAAGTGGMVSVRNPAIDRDIPKEAITLAREPLLRNVLSWQMHLW